MTRAPTEKPMRVTGRLPCTPSMSACASTFPALSARARATLKGLSRTLATLISPSGQRPAYSAPSNLNSTSCRELPRRSMASSSNLDTIPRPNPPITLPRPAASRGAARPPVTPMSTAPPTAASPTFHFRLAASLEACFAAVASASI
ncbi:hypothetical protein SNOG_20006 [Parastagonospora nodorum SN15]|uniref:Uncharacterized protein n=1 Tax=Phaeosphaeria nodorum (strain SN15 / ATCC MYA-4574 / FGSC 10173) TaxID=321614 RepID=A9JU00_PHANO|nr:hypothetical protein SNOG_20006 [Parastagonospora nodorum SN15]EDP89756.1 hypothetical protein SNOG_20006 [Parastagonospora nodorum SN15]